VIALLVPIQAWWADFTMREHPNWTFLALLVIMLQAISIYMVAALVLPDISGEKLVDLREHFFAHRRIIRRLVVPRIGGGTRKVMRNLSKRAKALGFQRTLYEPATVSVS
jgi:hypothetical protein